MLSCQFHCVARTAHSRVIKKDGVYQNSYKITGRRLSLRDFRRESAVICSYTIAEQKKYINIFKKYKIPRVC